MPKYVATGMGLVDKGTPVYPLNEALLLIKDDAKRGRAFQLWYNQESNAMFAYQEKSDSLFATSRTFCEEKKPVNLNPKFKVGDLVITQAARQTPKHNNVMRVIKVSPPPKIGVSDEVRFVYEAESISTSSLVSHYYTEDFLIKVRMDVVIDEEE